ncbi:MAG: anaerobic ribonucleoside-triphosphate reductase activating protein [Selenomonas sp.]|uniref:anaerobic ribonucleoside-triphosphate reductase activating protein n=1 Tax=Selenomonas sp. TaxID=2053611 RepID=UPI0025DFA6C6|nr:anaerobic ribonucleoside-triphosphate reductase activating protein [Selenomonas sp.]MCI6101320.1 anaerobic ribonucleoside-triphosphate reductase activating protein [Selenomonas sp.]MCI6232731.1 anaerobic ribonucleoside-triphosphate reductase activating protein [Selenomonas sp.]
MKLQIAGIVDDSIVDGDGCRLTVFVQGCPRRCPGCQNPETQPTEGGRTIDTAAILQQMAENPILSGITFSGGEPFLQPAPLADLARAVHQRGLDVWSYTGFTLEELEKRAEKDKATRALLRELDVLVDGPYEETQRDLTLHFRGSRNQRVIDMQKTRKAGRIVLLYTD